MAKVSNSIGMDKNWQARMDLETIMESCRIKKDKKRMQAVKQAAKERLDETTSNIGELTKIQESDSDSDY